MCVCIYIYISFIDIPHRNQIWPLQSPGRHRGIFEASLGFLAVLCLAASKENLGNFHGHATGTIVNGGFLWEIHGFNMVERRCNTRIILGY